MGLLYFLVFLLFKSVAFHGFLFSTKMFKLGFFPLKQNKCSCFNIFQFHYLESLWFLFMVVLSIHMFVCWK